MNRVCLSNEGGVISVLMFLLSDPKCIYLDFNSNNKTNTQIQILLGLADFKDIICDFILFLVAWRFTKISFSTFKINHFSEKLLRTRFGYLHSQNNMRSKKLIHLEIYLRADWGKAPQHRRTKLRWPPTPSPSLCSYPRGACICWAHKTRVIVHGSTPSPPHPLKTIHKTWARKLLTPLDFQFHPTFLCTISFTHYSLIFMKTNFLLEFNTKASLLKCTIKISLTGSKFSTKQLAHVFQ